MIQRGLYRRIKRGEVQVVGQYNDLARKVHKDIRTAKRNYEVRIARDASSSVFCIKIDPYPSTQSLMYGAETWNMSDRERD